MGLKKEGIKKFFQIVEKVGGDMRWGPDSLNSMAPSARKRALKQMSEDFSRRITKKAGNRVSSAGVEGGFLGPGGASASMGIHSKGSGWHDAVDLKHKVKNVIAEEDKIVKEFKHLLESVTKRRKAKVTDPGSMPFYDDLVDANKFSIKSRVPDLSPKVVKRPRLTPEQNRDFGRKVLKPLAKEARKELKLFGPRGK